MDIYPPKTTVPQEIIDGFAIHNITVHVCESINIGYFIIKSKDWKHEVKITSIDGLYGYFNGYKQATEDLK